MKKKNLATMLVALGLTAIIGVGATLAYLSDTTDVVTNTFTVGKIQITLDETDVDESTPNAVRDIENEYNVYPGQIDVTKDPVVHILADSEASWIFVKVTGVTYDTQSRKLTTTDGMVVTDAVGSDWTKYATTDGTLVFAHAKEAATDVAKDLQALFTKFDVSKDATDGEDIIPITVKAAAIQADGMTQAQAYAEVVW